MSQTLKPSYCALLSVLICSTAFFAQPPQAAWRRSVTRLLSLCYLLSVKASLVFGFRNETNSHRAQSPISSKPLHVNGQIEESGWGWERCVYTARLGTGSNCAVSQTRSLKELSSLIISIDKVCNTNSDRAVVEHLNCCAPGVSNSLNLHAGLRSYCSPSL
jgi:hypothetical protein